MKEISCGSHLKLARQSAGLDQYELAKVSGISQPTICRLKRDGDRRRWAKSITQMIRFAETCGVDPLPIIVAGLPLPKHLAARIQILEERKA